MLSIFLIQATAVAAGQSYGPGGALLLDGQDDYLSITPGCGNEHAFSADAVSLVAWVNVDSTPSARDAHVLGHPFEVGPRFYLTTADKVFKEFSPWFVNTSPNVTCTQANQTHYDHVERDAPLSASFTGAGWRHVALTYNTTHYWVYLDGEIHAHCETVNGFEVAPLEPSQLVHIGVNDHESDSNNQPFRGALDEIYYLASVLERDQVVALKNTGDTTGLDVILRLRFDSDAQFVDTSGNNNIVSVGGGLQGRSPRFVPSTAPIVGDQLLKWGRKRPLTAVDTAANTTDVTIELFSATTRDGTTLNATLYNISIADGSGQLLQSDGSVLDVSSGTVVLPDAAFIFRPSVGFVGEHVFTCDAVVETTATQIKEGPVLVDVSLNDNRAPVAGSGGYAISCDGLNDFLYNSDFEWPVSEYSHNGEKVVGGDPITIEFWGHIDESSERDSAVFSIGNQEVASDWVDDFNPYAKIGRLHANAPFSSGEAILHVGTYSAVKYNIRHLYEQWNHFAFVHDQASGNDMRIYVNGELALNGTHDHIAIARPNPNSFVPTNTEVRSLMLCSWSFWSEVYHKGIVDEVRVWRTARTREQIRESMHHTLQGDETDLYGYWNFDDLSPVAEPRGGNGDEFVAKDLTTNGNDLVFGGCAPCEDYFKAWMPYNEANGVFPPELVSERDPAGPGYRVCLPSAKSPDSAFFVQSETYGGAHCYGDNIQPDTRPTRVFSSAPIGGHIFPQVMEFETRTAIRLNGTDPDSGDSLVRVIHSLPRHGTLDYVTVDGLSSIVVVVNEETVLPLGVTTVYYTPNAGRGGTPLTSLTYSVSDGLTSSSIVEVEVHVRCPPGQAINSVSGLCAPCAPGAFSETASLETSCVLCSANQYQSGEGKTSCLSCDIGSSFSERGSSQCTPCPTERTSVAGFTVDSTQCERVISALPSDAHVITLSPLTNDSISLLSLPRFGALYQVEEGPRGIQRGAPILDAFFTSIFPISQYASGVIAFSSERSGHSSHSILGAPDVRFYGDSSNAWAMNARSDGVEDFIVVGFEEAVHVDSITIYETFTTGNVVSLEALNQNTGEWSMLWSGSPRTAQSSIVPFSPTLCPTFFKASEIRIGIKSSGVAGSIQIDAVEMVGVSSVAGYERVYVTDSHNRVIYELPELSTAPLSYVESFSYVSRQCHDASEPTKTSLSFDILMQPSIDTVSDGFVAVMLGFGIIGLLTTILTLFLFILYRNEQVIRASSTMFGVCVVGACVLLFVSSILFNIYQSDPLAHSNICVALPFTVGLAVSILFSSLFFKLFRIHRIFHAKLSTRGMPTAKTLLLCVLSVSGVDVLINLLWAVMNPLGTVLKTEGDVQVYVCSSDNVRTWYAVHYSTKAIFMCLTVIYCVKTRDVPSLFNEAKAIGFVSYNAVFCALLTVGVLSIVQDNIAATMAMVNFGLLVVGYVAVSVLFFPKFFHIWFGEMDSENNNGSNSSYLNSSQRVYHKSPNPIARNKYVVGAVSPLHFVKDSKAQRQIGRHGQVNGHQGITAKNGRKRSVIVTRTSRENSRNSSFNDEPTAGEPNGSLNVLAMRRSSGAVDAHMGLHSETRRKRHSAWSVDQSTERRATSLPNPRPTPVGRYQLSPVISQVTTRSSPTDSPLTDGPPPLNIPEGEVVMDE